MSFKNFLVKTLTKKHIKKLDQDTLMEIMRTSRMDTKFDENQHRISGWEIPQDVEFVQTVYKNIRLEEMCYNDTKNTENVILMFHGGGYLGRLNDIYSQFMYKLCNASLNYRVVSVEYRTSTIKPFPAAYEDALDAWEFLMNRSYKPENIIILGDSAGGGLGLALAMHLRDNNIKVKAYIGLSPWVDLNCNSEVHKNPKLRGTDPLFGTNRTLEICAEMYVGENDANDWRISPLYGNFDNLPKMFLTYGTCEILRKDVQNLYERASKKNDVVLKVYKGCQHDIQVMECKEADVAWQDISNFILSL